MRACLCVVRLCSFTYVRVCVCSLSVLGLYAITVYAFGVVDDAEGFRFAFSLALLRTPRTAIDWSAACHLHAASVFSSSP